MAKIWVFSLGTSISLSNAWKKEFSIYFIAYKSKHKCCFPELTVEEQFLENIHWAHLVYKDKETVDLQSNSEGIIDIQK